MLAIFGTDAGEWFVGFIIIFVVLAAVAALGYLPGHIAQKRSHPNASAIKVLGIVGVFTFGILWIVALIWAVMLPVKPTIYVQQEKSPDPVSKEPTKNCPFCAETIKAAARICRFCGKDVPPAQSQTEVDLSPIPLIEPEVKTSLPKPPALVDRFVICSQCHVCLVKVIVFYRLRPLN